MQEGHVSPFNGEDAVEVLIVNAIPDGDVLYNIPVMAGAKRVEADLNALAAKYAKEYADRTASLSGE